MLIADLVSGFINCGTNEVRIQGMFAGNSDTRVAVHNEIDIHANHARKCIDLLGHGDDAVVTCHAVHGVLLGGAHLLPCVNS